MTTAIIGLQRLVAGMRRLHAAGRPIPPTMYGRAHTYLGVIWRNLDERLAETAKR